MVLLTWEDCRILKIIIYKLDGQAKGMETPDSYATFQDILLSLEDRQLSVCDHIAGSFYASFLILTWSQSWPQFVGYWLLGVGVPL